MSFEISANSCCLKQYTKNLDNINKDCFFEHNNLITESMITYG